MKINLQTKIRIIKITKILCIEIGHSREILPEIIKIEGTQTINVKTNMTIDQTNKDIIRKITRKEIIKTIIQDSKLKIHVLKHGDAHGDTYAYDGHGSIEDEGSIDDAEPLFLMMHQENRQSHQRKGGCTQKSSETRQGINLEFLPNNNRSYCTVYIASTNTKTIPEGYHAFLIGTESQITILAEEPINVSRQT
jgi:hypothetical protein